MNKYYQSIIFVGDNNSLQNLLKDKMSINTIDAPNQLIIRRQLNKKTIGIKEIGLYKEFSILKGYNKNFKLIIFDEGELLTIPAQNSLLKILEEPNPDTQIIIRCNTKPNFLNTVLSRCSIIYGPKLESPITKNNFLNLPFYKRIESFNEILFEKDPLIKERKIEELFKSLTENLLIELESNIGNRDKISTIQQNLNKIKEIRQKIKQNVNIKLSLDNLALIGNIP